MFDKYKDQEIELLDEDFDSNDDVEDIDTDEHFLNYEDPEWVHDSYRWTEEEKQESDKKVVSTKEMPF